MMSTNVNQKWAKDAQNQSRLSFGLAVTSLAQKDEKIVAVSSDTIDLMGLREMMRLFPERILETGIAEQNAMGIASGLATTGMRPYVCGYAPFITARSMEQLRNDVAYANQPVVIGAACSGITLAVSGGTHHAIEDLALMRSFPNMKVIVPADAHEAWHLTHATETIDGPCYIRLGGRHEEKPVTPVDAKPAVGEAIQLRGGSDVTIIACGALVSESLTAADQLLAKGIKARVLNMHTIKPLDKQSILKAAEETGRIVTAEEHHVTGGLGGAIAELLAEFHPTPMRFVGMPDEFAVVGPTAQVRAKYGMCASNIMSKCAELLKY